MSLSNILKKLRFFFFLISVWLIIHNHTHKHIVWPQWVLSSPVGRTFLKWTILTCFHSGSRPIKCYVLCFCQTSSSPAGDGYSSTAYPSDQTVFSMPEAEWAEETSTLGHRSSEDASPCESLCRSCPLPPVNSAMPAVMLPNCLVLTLHN